MFVKAMVGISMTIATVAQAKAMKQLNCREKTANWWDGYPFHVNIAAGYALVSDGDTACQYMLKSDSELGTANQSQSLRIRIYEYTSSSSTMQIELVTSGDSVVSVLNSFEDKGPGLNMHSEPSFSEYLDCKPIF